MSIVCDLGIGSLTFTQDKEEQFHAARNIHFVENSKNIILDGVLAKSHSLRDFTIRKTLHQPLHHFALALGQVLKALGLNHRCARSGCQGLDDVSKVTTVDPNLSVMDRM